jgi:hypothetical protein
MKRIAYLDHSFHKKTLSTDFIPELLRRKGYVVDYFWDELWCGGKGIDWESIKNYDVIIMFQSFCNIQNSYFCKLHHNVIFIPMLDQFGIWQGPLFNLNAFWERFQGSKVISFSNAVHGLSVGYGIKSYYTKYYPKIDVEKISLRLNNKKPRGFFWLRRESELPWDKIRILINETEFENLHIHLAHDPGSPEPTLPSAEDIIKFNITTSTWFDNKEEYNNLLHAADIFFTPRMEEGIGQSFLEALSRGQCVVAPNHGTMNEYIIHELNGLLYDATSPKPLDLSNYIQIGNNAQAAVIAGRAAWDNNEDQLVEYILQPSADFYNGKYNHSYENTKNSAFILNKINNAFKKYTLFEIFSKILFNFKKHIQQLRIK